MALNVIEKFSMNGRCSIVTGAAMGLGYAMANTLAQAGSNIVIADINAEKANRSAMLIKQKGVNVIVVECDVRKTLDCNNVAETALKEFGSIDVLINNAGICKYDKIEDVTLDDWYTVMDVNLNGMFIMSQTVGRIMISKKRGSIINIASMSGLIVNVPQCQCAYNTSKAGVIMLTKTMAVEWAKHNIRVNAIAPGYMKTELTRRQFEENGEMVKRWLDLSPFSRPGTPDELEGIALFLASDASSFASGAVFTIDGAYTAV